MKAKSGITKVKLATQYSVSRAVVKRWSDEALKPVPNWEDARRSGRPSKLDATERRNVRRQARSRKRVGDITTRVNKKRSDHVSESTVRRVLVNTNPALQWLPVSRGRRLSDKNKSQRFDFCTQHQNAQTGAWLFCDSKYFYMYPDGSGSLKWAWQDPSNRLAVSSCSNPVVLHIYAVVGRGVKSDLIFTAPTPPAGSKQRKSKQTFTGARFVEVAKQLHGFLQSVGKASPRHPVLLDHARQHTAQDSKAAMDNMGFYYKQDFPAQSWDINIIENVWGVLEMKLQQMPGRCPTTPDGWKRRLRAAWDQVDQSTIDKLVDSVKGRIEGVIAVDGAWLFKHSS